MMHTFNILCGQRTHAESSTQLLTQGVSCHLGCSGVLETSIWGWWLGVTHTLPEQQMETSFEIRGHLKGHAYVLDVSRQREREIINRMRDNGDGEI